MRYVVLRTKLIYLFLTEKVLHAVKAVKQPKQRRQSKRTRLIVSIPRDYMTQGSFPDPLTVRLPRSVLSSLSTTVDYHHREAEAGFAMIEAQGVPLEHHKGKWPDNTLGEVGFP